MNKNLKIVIFGLMVWLVPFLVSFMVFPIKDSMRPLFESIMPLILTIVVVTLSFYYMKNLDANFVKEGILIGFAWYIINIAIDLVMFLPESPMHMGFADYMMDIGLTYVMIPVITIGMGFLLDAKSSI